MIRKPTNIELVGLVTWLLGLSFFAGVAWSRIEDHEKELTIIVGQRFDYLLSIDQRLSRIEGKMGISP